ADFRMSVVAMHDGRVLNGMVRATTDRTLTLQAQTERLVLDRTEIDAVRPSPLSLMPEGIVDPLTEPEVRDLLVYLMSRTQVPLPPQNEENASHYLPLAKARALTSSQDATASGCVILASTRRCNSIRSASVRGAVSTSRSMLAQISSASATRCS